LLKRLVLASAMLALASCGQHPYYDYTHLPTGYNWRAVLDRQTGAIVFYGQDPLTKDTVYVGPDSRFYIFRHPGLIQPQDLKLHWMPHDAQ
jgi:hypothetical protein